MNSARNIPERFAGAIRTDPASAAAGVMAERVQMVRHRIASGIDPLYVGELVREGIENDWPYIFTDTEFESAIAARFDAIRQGFDRVRSRAPKR